MIREDDWGVDLHKDQDEYGQIPYTHNKGINEEDEDYPEKEFVRCRKCGFPFNRARHYAKEVHTTISTGVYFLVASGWGGPWGSMGWGGGSGVKQYYGDPTVDNGCPFCGYAGN